MDWNKGQKMLIVLKQGCFDPYKGVIRGELEADAPDGIELTNVEYGLLNNLGDGLALPWGLNVELVPFPDVLIPHEQVTAFFLWEDVAAWKDIEEVEES